MLALTAITAHGLPLNHQSLQVDLPIARVGVDVDVGHLTLVVVRIRASQEHLSALLGLGISVEPERENWIYQALGTADIKQNQFYKLLPLTWFTMLLKGGITSRTAKLG